MSNRIVGRPRRGPHEVGADKIVAEARMALLADYYDVSSRRTIAEQCGVTPALITYYFPEREALLRRIVLHPLDAEIEKIRRMARSADTYTLDELIHGITDFLYEFRHFLRAFDLMKALGLFSSEDSYDHRLMREIDHFLSDVKTPAHANPFPRASFPGAIWGMCKLKAGVRARTDMVDALHV